MNLLMIFVVCAIGADDLFIFMDAYALSEFEGPRVMKPPYRPRKHVHGDCKCKNPPAAYLNFTTRMDWVYRRSGLAMFITTRCVCARAWGGWVRGCVGACICGLCVRAWA